MPLKVQLNDNSKDFQERENNSNCKFKQNYYKKDVYVKINKLESPFQRKELALFE